MKPWTCVIFVIFCPEIINRLAVFFSYLRDKNRLGEKRTRKNRREAGFLLGLFFLELLFDFTPLF